MLVPRLSGEDDPGLILEIIAVRSQLVFNVSILISLWRQKLRAARRPLFFPDEDGTIVAAKQS